jgi:ubiquitin-protein ligase
MIFALIVRLAHWAPVYAIATIFFAVVFVLVAERVSASMNSDETRG